MAIVNEYLGAGTAGKAAEEGTKEGAAPQAPPGFEASEEQPKDAEGGVPGTETLDDARNRKTKKGGSGKAKGSRKESRAPDADSGAASGAAAAEGEGKVARRACECQATRHELVANCLSCGRIVCSEEGEGPCAYCGALVTRDREQRYEELLERCGRVGRGAGTRAVGAAIEEEAVAAANREKEKLLGYDKDAKKKTRVIDDQSDAWSIDQNVWMTREEKEILKQREAQIEAQNKDKRVYITFDLIGRKVVQSQGGEGGGGEGEESWVEASAMAAEAETLSCGELAGIPANPLVEERVHFKSKR